MIDLETLQIKPLSLNCLSYPSGLALSKDEDILYVAETGKNRLLRFVISDMGVYLYE